MNSSRILSIVIGLLGSPCAQVALSQDLLPQAEPSSVFVQVEDQLVPIGPPGEVRAWSIDGEVVEAEVETLSSFGPFGSDSVLILSVNQHSFLPAELMLPTPGDPSDLFITDLDVREIRHGHGWMIPLNLTTKQSANPFTRFDISSQFGLFFDSGFAGTGRLPQEISLTGSDDPRSRQTFFTTKFTKGDDVVLPVNLISDTQLLDLGGQHVQFFIDANNYDISDELDVEHVGARVRSRATGTSLVIGKLHSLFGYGNLQPSGLTSDRLLIGTADRRNDNLAQLAVHVPFAPGLSGKVAVEEPVTSDIQLTSGTVLQRWPHVAAHISYEEGNNVLQVAALARSLGFQAVSGSEHFTTGWGLSALLKWAPDTSAFYVGVAAGEGIGTYIHGVSRSAFGSADSIAALSTVGAFVGYRRAWFDGDKPLAAMNAAYGYVYMETPPGLGATTNGELQHAWINCMKHVGSNVVVGCEYEYGFREVNSEDRGENHRVMLLVGITAVKTEKPLQLYVDGLGIDDAAVREQVGLGYGPSGPAYRQRL